MPSAVAPPVFPLGKANAPSNVLPISGLENGREAGEAWTHDRQHREPAVAERQGKAAEQQCQHHNRWLVAEHDHNVGHRARRIG